MNKKADTWTLREAVMMVFVAFIMIPTFGYFNDLQAQIFGTKDDGSISNFENRLYKDMKDMISSTASAEYRTENYYLGEDKFLVGFDYDWDGEAKVYDTILDRSISKPYKCGNSACICLYKGEPDDDASNRDKNIVMCKSEAFAGKKVVFSGEKASGNGQKGMQRQDGTYYLVLEGREKNVQYTYIEKKYDANEGKYSIYMSKIDTSKTEDPAAMRKKAIDDSAQ